MCRAPSATEMSRAWREAVKPSFCRVGSDAGRGSERPGYGVPMTITADDRAAMSELFLEAGPDAPTLWEGWTPHVLRTHLLVRERRPEAAAGAFIPPLSKYAKQVSA